jgi:uncharacterized protein YciI
MPALMRIADELENGPSAKIRIEGTPSVTHSGTVGARMYYLLIYKTVDNYVEKRAPYRAEHLAYADAAHARGELVMGGALADPADSAILVFKAESPIVVEDFARNDPYVKAGLIKEWSVRPWTVVIGG